METVPARGKALITADWGLTALLFLLSFNLLILSPASRLGAIIRLLNNVSLILLLLAGILAIGRGGLFRPVAAGLVLLTCILRIMNLFLDLPWLYESMLVLTGVCYVLILFVVAKMVLGEGPVTAHRIQGAVALYLFIAVFFTVLYTLLETVFPGAFRFPDDWHPGRADLSDDLAYFSFVTMTTVGYGDVTAVHPFARSLAMFEALIGQLYPAILIARLVTLYSGSTKPSKEGEGGSPAHGPG